jgi:ferredoxin
MKVKVDKTLCAGCGTCVEICPEVFEMQGDVVLNIIGEDKDIPEQYEATCDDAVNSCPVEALIIEE